MQWSIFWVWSLTVLMSSTHCQQWYETGNPHFLDASNVFEAVRDASTIKVLKFFSPWCKYCRYIKTYVDNYKSKNEISHNLKFYQFNCQGNAGMFCAQHFQVRAYPAVIMYDQKGDSISRIDGLYPEEVIYNILNDLNRRAIQLNKTLTQQQIKNQTLPSSVPIKDVKKQHQTQQQSQQVDKQIKQQSPVAKNSTSEQARQQQKVVSNSQDTKANKQVSKQPEGEKGQSMEAVKIKDNEVKEVPLVNKQIVEEGEGQQETKDVVSSASPNKQDSDRNEQVQSSVPILLVKYLLYLVGAGIGGAYAYRICKTKHHSQGAGLPDELHHINTRSPHQGAPLRKNIASKDIENQMLVEEVLDQNL